MAFEDVHQRVIESLAVGEHPRHELRWIIPLEPRRLIRLNSVGRAVGLAEGIPSKARDQSPNLNRLLRRTTSRKRRSEELPADFLDDGMFLFVQGATQNIGATWGQDVMHQQTIIEAIDRAIADEKNNPGRLEVAPLRI